MLHVSCSLLNSSSSISPCRWGRGALVGGGSGGAMDSSSNTTRPNLAQADVPLIKAQLNSLLPLVGRWGGGGWGGEESRAAADRLAAKQHPARLGRPDVHHEVTQIALARPPLPNLLAAASSRCGTSTALHRGLPYPPPQPPTQNSSCTQPLVCYLHRVTPPGPSPFAISLYAPPPPLCLHQCQ